MNRVLIHGFGSIGRRHARVVAAIEPDAECAILSLHGSQQSAVTSGLRVFTDWASARAFEPQRVIVANAASAHIETAQAWLNAGAHVLVEKPLATSAEEAQALLRTQAQVGRAAQVGYNLRFLPALQLFRRVLQERRYGRVLSIRAEVGQSLLSWRADKPMTQSVSAQKQLGGGALLELSHEIDYLQWIFGPCLWVNGNCFEHADWGLDVEDTVHLLCAYADGIVARVDLDFVRADTTRRCVAICADASVEWDARTQTVRVCGANQNAGSSAWETLLEQATTPDASYEAQWRDFSQRCIGGLSIGASLEEAHQVLQTVDAARASHAASGARVALGDAHSAQAAGFIG